MDLFRITGIGGAPLGEYQAKNAEAALDMLARDIGYEDWQAAVADNRPKNVPDNWNPVTFVDETLSEPLPKTAAPAKGKRAGKEAAQEPGAPPAGRKAAGKPKAAPEAGKGRKAQAEATPPADAEAKPDADPEVDPKDNAGIPAFLQTGAGAAAMDKAEETIAEKLGEQ